MNKYLKLEYWNTCDLGNIYYQGGQKFWFYLDADVAEPFHEDVEDGQENGDGEFIPTYRRQMKRYIIRTGLLSDYLIDAIQRMKLHDNIYLTFKTGEIEQIYNVDCEAEWQFEKYAWQGTVTLTFDMDESITVGACCDNLTVETGEPIPDYYWIASDGDDGTGDGSYTTPWKTLAYACTQVGAGETINMKAGTYTLSSQVALPVGVSIKGQGTGTIITSNAALNPIITASSAEGNPIDGDQSISYLKFDGNSRVVKRGIYSSYRNNVSIHHVTFEDFDYNAIQFTNAYGYYTPPTYDLATGNSVTYCTFNDCGPEPTSGVLGGALRVIAQSGFIGDYNIFNNTGRVAGENAVCIIPMWIEKTRFNHNTFYINDYNGANWSTLLEPWNYLGDFDISYNICYGHGVIGCGGVLNQVSVGCTYGVRISHNQFLNDSNVYRTYLTNEVSKVAIVIEGNGHDRVYIHNNLIQRYGWGIELSTPTSRTGGTFEYNWTMDDIYIYYNIIADVGYVDFTYTHGIILVNETNYDGYVTTTDGVYIYNNDITAMTGSTYSGIQMNANGTLSNVEIKNNIIKDFDAYPVRFEAHASDSLDLTNCDVIYNDFYNNGTGTVYIEAAIVQTNVDVATGNITDDPTFVSASDFHLQAGSPCINAGIATGHAFITTDYDGQPVGNPPEIGAYEYQE